MTQRQINEMSTAKRIQLFKQLIKSFDCVEVTGLYRCSCDIDSSRVKIGTEYEDRFVRPENSITIETDICSG